MKTNSFFLILSLMAGPVLAADTAAPKSVTPKTEAAHVDTAAKDAVIAAAKALGGKTNYSWSTTVTVPEGGQFRPGPTTGETEKDGYTHVTMSFGGNTSEMVVKGDKGVIKLPDQGWQTVAELEADENGPGRFAGAMVRNFKSPADQAAELAAGTKGLKKEGDMYSGDLTEETAKTLLTFRRAGNISASEGKGSAKFWVKDGVLTKVESHVTGKVNFNGNDREVDRTSTVEIKDVNATKVPVPEAATKKLNPPAATADESKSKK